MQSSLHPGLHCWEVGGRGSSAQSCDFGARTEDLSPLCPPHNQAVHRLTCHGCLHSSWPGLSLKCSSFFLYTSRITHIIVSIAYHLPGSISSSPPSTSLVQTLITLNLGYYNELLIHFNPNWSNSNLDILQYQSGADHQELVSDPTKVRGPSFL